MLGKCCRMYHLLRFVENASNQNIAIQKVCCFAQSYYVQDQKSYYSANTCVLHVVYSTFILIDSSLLNRILDSCRYIGAHIHLYVTHTWHKSWTCVRACCKPLPLFHFNLSALAEMPKHYCTLDAAIRQPSIQWCVDTWGTRVWWGVGQSSCLSLEWSSLLNSF